MALIMFLLGARLKAFKLSIIQEAVKNKHTKLMELYKESGRFYTRLIAVKLLLFFIVLGASIVGTVIYIILTNINAWLALIVGILIVIIVVIALLYREAALILEDTTALNAISRSFEIFRKNKFYVISVAIIVGIVNFLIIAANQFISQNDGMITTIFALIYLFVALIVSAWTNVFVFSTYNSMTATKNKTTRKIIRKKSVKKRISKKSRR
ncbi:MAG: hypothetical protein Q8Q42_03635 [Nanoarchaeota archaeon]|nr:hypothetical protein [Nanoarchaeota archaeon]